MVAGFHEAGRRVVGSWIWFEGPANRAWDIRKGMKDLQAFRGTGRGHLPAAVPLFIQQMFEHLPGLRVTD